MELDPPAGPREPAPDAVILPIQAVQSARELRVGTLLGESFAVYLANFVPFTLIAGLVLAPVVLLEAWLPSSGMSETAVDGFKLLAQLASAVLTPIVTGAVVFAVFQQMLGRRIPVGEVLRSGMSNMLHVLFVAILQGIIIVLGVVACIVPGLMLAASYAVAVPVTVHEELDGMAALQRSARLTDGYRWPVFWVLVLIFVAQLPLLFLAEILLGEAAAGLLGTTVAGVVNVLYTAVSSTAAAVLYYRLRSAKEGLDVAEIASVFA